MKNHTQVTSPMGSTLAQANSTLANVQRLSAQGEAISHALLIAVESPDHELSATNVAEIQRLLHSLLKKINEHVQL